MGLDGVAWQVSSRNSRHFRSCLSSDGMPTNSPFMKMTSVSAVTILAKAETLPGRPIGLAHPSPVPFEQLLRDFARIGTRP